VQALALAQRHPQARQSRRKKETQRLLFLFVYPRGICTKRKGKFLPIERTMSYTYIYTYKAGNMLEVLEWTESPFCFCFWGEKKGKGREEKEEKRRERKEKSFCHFC
jgi:hypothetical protein